MGSTFKTSNWMAYAILVTILITLLSCSVSAQPVSVEGDELTFDGGEIVEVIKDAGKAASDKAAEAKAYAESPEGKAKAKANKAKAKDVLDTTGEALKGFTNFVAGGVADAAHWVEKKTK